MQVKRLFRQCRIVGKRFPIAHVTVGNDLLEVSSFNTRADRSLIPPDAAALFDTKVWCLLLCRCGLSSGAEHAILLHGLANTARVLVVAVAAATAAAGGPRARAHK